MELWIGALNLGFLYSFLTMGVFITFRIYDFPDITVDGSFTTGAATAAVMIVSGADPFIALPVSFFAGAMAGAVTAFINTRFNVNGLLAGILVMTGLYSVNLHIMNRSNIPLLNCTSFITYIDRIIPASSGIPQEIRIFLALCPVMTFFWIAVSLFLKTDIGISIRITGNNPNMASAAGVNVNLMKIFGVALSNGLAGISGCLVAQYQGFADIGMGIGTILVALASVIIGESIFKHTSIYIKVASVIIGSVIFRMMIAIALYVGMNPIDLKLLTSAFVLFTLVISMSVNKGKKISNKLYEMFSRIVPSRQAITGICITFIFIIAAFLGYRHFAITSETPKRMVLFYFADTPLISQTIQGVKDELEKKGILRRDHITLDLKCAQGEFTIAQSIVQDIIRQKYDYILTLSTPALQVTAQINKTIPHVFGAVTDPYRMGVASDPKTHQKNLTGVATLQPVEKTIEIMRELFKNAKSIGIVWNPAEACSEACTYKARDACKKYGFELIERNVSSTSEVMENTKSLITHGVDIFLTSGDNTVIAAIDSIALLLHQKKIPYFSNDPADVETGRTLVSVGADYYEVGKQTALMAKLVIDGEKPEKIAINNFAPAKIAINLPLAKDLNLIVPDTFLQKAQKIKKE